MYVSKMEERKGREMWWKDAKTETSDKANVNSLWKKVR